ncbi:hypothetical protein [Asticcacaulis sp. AC402]|uniref:hypothetical protein n=1 Tax=Asticcacaulis sp. AC402 TaxID=1282361 RepID=UPI0003C3EB21|nr:hypothetical protein [Asticcacaulis sp. AC402]ESQ73668.1 hypothetical protein ABAC402_18145 [Asticcacaulis sp. AC402]
MQLSMRYGLAGIGGLILLSAVQWLRDQPMSLDPFGAYLAGVTPNFAAAIAICFVLLSIWASHRRDTNVTYMRSRFLVCAAISGLGLIGWELVQRTSQRFVFDIHDMLATLAGIGTSALVFFIITPNTSDKSDIEEQDAAP